MNQQLHIVSFDIPFPPVYGGIIDVWAKIKALHQAGVKVILHCFQYRDKKPAPELAVLCREVYYYPRPLGLGFQFSTMPYVVRTRQTRTLLENLGKDEHPILFEGLHTCAFIHHAALAGRRKLVRMHNVEWQYYLHLSHLEPNWIKKAYLLLESMRLRAFESKVLAFADVVFPISIGDDQYFRSLTTKNVHYLPAFHGCGPVTSPPGKGAFALFHGNLSVRDNERAAIFLAEQVFAATDFPFIIAGLSPGAGLEKVCARHANIQLVNSPSEAEMSRLIREAHLHILFSFQADGIKIKLLRALHQGRFVIVNRPIIRGTGLELLCEVVDNAEQIRTTIRQLLAESFSPGEVEKRRQVLSQHYSDEAGARQILEFL